jgi:hypothetical protein
MYIYLSNIGLCMFNRIIMIRCILIYSGYQAYTHIHIYTFAEAFMVIYIYIHIYTYVNTHTFHI